MMVTRVHAVTIPAGKSTTPAIDIAYARDVAVVFPEVWASAGLAVLVSPSEDGTYVPLCKTADGNEEAVSAAREIIGMPHVRVEGLFTHLALRGRELDDAQIAAAAEHGVALHAPDRLDPAALATAIVAGTPVEPSFRDGLYVQRVLDAIAHSAANDAAWSAV